MRIFLLFTILSFIGCEKEIEPCSVEVIEAKSNLEENFKKLNTENPSLSYFSIQLESYLSRFKDSKCKIDDKEFHPHEEIKALSEEIQLKNINMSIKVVYGDDDRVDVVDHPNTEVRGYAHSVAAMISKSQVSTKGVLIGETLGARHNLCSGEKFSEQKVVASCSGFLVDDDLLVTAGHCVSSSGQCESNYRWVFGFSGESYEVSADDIYQCDKVISYALNDSTEVDYAVVKLDRKVEGRKPLRFRLNGKVQSNSELVVLGHPSGVSLKVADNAIVRGNNNEHYFSSNLDTFGGNSGSPVINIDTGVVEGILVRGEQDYIGISNPDGSGGSCNVTFKCEDSGCMGEESTRMTSVKGLDHFEIKGASFDYNYLFSGELSSSEHFPVKVRMKKGQNYNLAGRRFLDSCISHIYERGSHTWLSESSYDCSIESFEGIYQSYVDLGDQR